MKLIPLIDRAGQVRAWADRQTGLICDLNGKVIALIKWDGVFRANANAEQVGWFEGDHVRNRRGQVVLIQPSAKLDGVVTPRPKKIPPPPKMHVPLGQPLLRWLLPPPVKQHAWADFQSLFDDGLAQVRAFEQQVRRLANKPHQSPKICRKRTGKPQVW